MSLRDIKAMLPSELEEYFRQCGERSFRAGQVFQWLHSGVRSFDEMTNLPVSLRNDLESGFYITVPELIEAHVSERDGTIKYLWRMRDGAAIESVLMEYEHWNTVCISTQVGCRMGCLFCASAIGGLERNLAASEMLDQVMFSQYASGKKVSNIVLMGIGEPLDNFDEVLRFLQLVTDSSGINIGARHITLSTCGIAENIDKLADCGIQLTITASLHAPDDETRTRLMPGKRISGVDALLEATSRYFKKTGRRVTFEYALIEGVNDGIYQAKLLSEKLKGTGSHLNIIKLNDVPERAFKPSSAERVQAFTALLKREGLTYTVRRSLGGDITASCGQLRRKLLN